MPIDVDATSLYRQPGLGIDDPTGQAANIHNVNTP